MACIEHVAFWVRDLDRCCAFYAAYFGAEIGPLYQNPQKGFASRFLRLDSGARLELMTLTRLASEAALSSDPRAGYAHLAISLGSVEAVDELTRTLAAAGIAVVGAARWTGDGYYESVVLDPEGNRLELTA